MPDWPGLSEVPFLTNTSMMVLDTLPDHLIVAGGSYIGLEFAQMYRRFGSRVTVVEYADRLIAREDPDVRYGARNPGSRRDRYSPACRDIAVERRGGGVRMTATVETVPSRSMAAIYCSRSAGCPIRKV